MKRFLIVFAMIALIAAACSDSDDGSSDTGGQSTQATTGNSSNGGTGDGNGGGDQNGDSDDDPPDDDAADIVGNPDLDLDEFPDDVADALTDIAGFVSIGDCEAAGLKATVVPEGWVCRVLDEPIAGQDGFTMFMEGNELNITITTPSPLGPPCELLQLCDTAEPIALSANFPDTTSLDVAGTVLIVGTHLSVDAELVITKLSALTPDEMELVMTVLDFVEPC